MADLSLSKTKQAKGIYILVIKFKGNHRISVGKFPEKSFRQGIYLYAGRAKNSLHGRVMRHLRKEKKLFWHIDYFLQKAEIIEIWIKRNFLDECQIARQIKNLLKDSLFPLNKFGSSDCGCISHLFFLPENKADLDSLRKKLFLERIDFHGNQV